MSVRAGDPSAFVRVRRPRRVRLRWQDRAIALSSRPGVGGALAIAFVAGCGLYGAMRGGEYDAFIQQNGSVLNVAARMAGLGIHAITITGARDTYEAEILHAGNITATDSLLTLDVVSVRDRILAQVPLVRDVSVRKMYPDRLLIEIVEREPLALWQKDGTVMVIAADGTAIQDMRDARFADLPFVVGEGANARTGEYLKIIAAAGDLRGRIRAGTLIGQRRWNLKMASGLEVKLPEDDPVGAVAQFAQLARDARLLDKDLLSVDMRFPGRMVARLSEEAAAARAETLSSRKKGKGST